MKSTNLFYIFFYINVFCKGIGLDNSSIAYVALLIFGVFVLGMKYITTYYSKNELVKILFLVVVGTLSFIFTSKPTLMLTCLCLAGMKGADIESLFKGTYVIRLLTFLSIVGLSFTGVVENTSIQMWRSEQLDVRYSLGFGHPNSLHLAFFILIAAFLYVNFYKMNFFQYVMLIIIDYFIYSFSGSRTGFWGSLLLIGIMMLAHIQFHKLKQILCIVPKYAFMVLQFSSFVLAWAYGKFEAVKGLDMIFNGRLSYSNYFITNYGISLFGNSLVEEDALFDNGYLFLYIQFGVVGMLLIGGLIYMICKDIERNMDVRKAALVLIFLVYIFTESFSPNIFMNIILIFAGPLLYHKSSGITDCSMQFAGGKNKK